MTIPFAGPTRRLGVSRARRRRHGAERDGVRIEPFASSELRARGCATARSFGRLGGRPEETRTRRVRRARRRRRRGRRPRALALALASARG